MRTQQEAAEPNLAKVAADIERRRAQQPKASDSCQPISRDLGKLEAKFSALADQHAARSERLVEQEDRRRRDREHAEALDAWRKIQASIGARYSKATFDSYQVYDRQQQAVVDKVRQYATNLPEHAERGECLILYGPCGTGKDHLMTCVLREAAMTHRMRVAHAYGLDLHAKVRDSIDDDRVEKTLAPYREATVLGLSDPIANSGDLTPWQRQTLMRLVNTRYIAMRPTILTINAASLDQTNGEAIWNDLTDPVVDRLTHGAVLVRCAWPSYRQRAAK